MDTRGLRLRASADTKVRGMGLAAALRLLMVQLADDNLKCDLDFSVHHAVCTNMVLRSSPALRLCDFARVVNLRCGSIMEEFPCEIRK